MDKVFQLSREIFSDADFWKIFIPVISMIIAWHLNEKSKRLHEEFLRKEDRYINILNALEGFSSQNENKNELREKFLEELKLAWLHCPDEIINSIHQFLEDSKADKSTAESRCSAIKNIIFSMRKDLLSRKIVNRTRLKADDFKLIYFEKDQSQKNN